MELTVGCRHRHTESFALNVLRTSLPIALLLQCQLQKQVLGSNMFRKHFALNVKIVCTLMPNSPSAEMSVGIQHLESSSIGQPKPCSSHDIDRQSKIIEESLAPSLSPEKFDKNLAFIEQLGRFIHYGRHSEKWTKKHFWTYMPTSFDTRSMTRRLLVQDKYLPWAFDYIHKHWSVLSN